MTQIAQPQGVNGNGAGPRPNRTPMSSDQPAPPIFPPALPLNISKEDRKKIADATHQRYVDNVQQRTQWQAQHQLYDDMFRGVVDSNRTGPWEGSSNLHVQAPYWLVDSINTRLVMGIWSQVPLIAGKAERDEDQEAFRDAVSVVDWCLQPKRMNARAMWSQISKVRLIHGFGVGLITHVKDTYTYPVAKEIGITVRLTEDGMLDPGSIDEVAKSVDYAEGIRYHGCILTPYGYDDIITPINGQNLQPLTPSNPLGMDWVMLRHWEPISQIWKKRKSSYTYIDQLDDRKTVDDWIAAAPSQDRSTTVATSENQSAARQGDLHEGKNRSLEGRRTPRGDSNPEFEVVTVFMPWEIKGEQVECVFWVELKSKITLGGFRLASLYWKNERPLLDLHYQRVPGRYMSMGVMEICRHLSAELDTIHNMRIDIGQATNMPFFFYRSTSHVNPKKITLAPLTGVPVDDVNDIRFPQMQNVTTFYHQEEQLLYTLIERVMGVTDLFLGMSPTQGAAARHATGFVGTQQESMARMTEVVTSDAEAFSFLCRTVYNMELQWGPKARHMRLLGKEGPVSTKIDRNQLWMAGEYDFRLGANHGLFASAIAQQKADALMAWSAQSPLAMGAPERIWERDYEYLSSKGFEDPERFIGPREATSSGTPKPQDEENMDMAQYLHGDGVPSPVHPNDNDEEHIAELNTFLISEEYTQLGRPNYRAYLAHQQQHQNAIQAKFQQQQQMQQAAMMGMGQGQPGQAGGPENARNVAQLQGTGSTGAMGDPNAGGQGAPADAGQSASFSPPSMG